MNVRAWSLDNRVYVGGSLDGCLAASSHDQDHRLAMTQPETLGVFRAWFYDKWQSAARVYLDTARPKWQSETPGLSRPLLLNEPAPHVVARRRSSSEQIGIGRSLD